MLNLSHLSLSLAGLVFDSRTGDSYQINSSAILIIKLFQTKKSLEEISKILVENFSLTYEQALLDILEFKTQLSIIGLIE
jgi:hypothetical protein